MPPHVGAGAGVADGGVGEINNPHAVQYVVPAGLS